MLVEGRKEEKEKVNELMRRRPTTVEEAFLRHSWAANFYPNFGEENIDCLKDLTLSNQNELLSLLSLQ